MGENRGRRPAAYKAGRNACPTWQATGNAVISELSESSECSVSSVDSEFSEEFCCSRNCRKGESGRRAFVKLTGRGEPEEKVFCKTKPL